MTWIKLDDKAPRHPKVAALTDRAFRWWVKGLCYASEFLTNGVLHPVFWRQVPKQSRAELTGQHLWDWDDPNFLIHDYLDHQSSKEDVEAEKKRNREKVAAFRERRKSERRGNPGNQLVTGNGEQPVTGNTVPPGNRLVTDPENRDQRSEIREQKESAKNALSTRAHAKPLIVSPLEFERKHGHHLGGFCDWVCFPMELVDRFAKRIPGEDEGLKRAEIKSWAVAIRAKWADQVIPDGSDFDFWTNRWTETHGGSRPAAATLKAVRAERAIDEAFR